MQYASGNKIREQDTRLKDKMRSIKRKFIVMSGKGGVGKTTVAVNIAYGLALRGYKTGILDVDIHGPNVAKMLGIEDKALSGSDKGIEPVESIPGLKVVSIALIETSKNQPVIWRGPLKMGVIKQFLSDVNWGSLDFLIVDSPPGTGDEPLSVCQLIPDLNGALIVTTPQDVAILDSRKSVLFAKELNIPVTGVIENMSGFVCPHCGGHIDLFGKDGGRNAAAQIGVPFLGAIPFEPNIVGFGDSGKPFINSSKDGIATGIMKVIIDKIVGSLE
ncbi:MAG: ATP-binding protein [Candidatus Omnitrophica bacterium 4484_171]|nr:MAG: ATP-binding protein [Candidatus Omnitrophica bacterium 4484_171]